MCSHHLWTGDPGHPPPVTQTGGLKPPRDLQREGVSACRAPSLAKYRKELLSAVVGKPHGAVLLSWIFPTLKADQIIL